MSPRRIALIAALVTGLVLVAAGAAGAATDLYGNVGPGQSLSGIAGRYPLSHYTLDQHFDAVSASLAGGVDASGIPPMIAYFLASVVWQITAFLANAVITLFTFAFSLDLLNGSTDTGGTGALQPVAAAIQGMYRHTFGQAWMVIGIVVAGCWAMWKALVQRRYTETAGALALSLAFCVIALAIVSQPAATIGQVSKWTNQMSTAFLSVTTNGQVATSQSAKTQVADRLFRLLIYEPWTALDFGGTEHCVATATGSADHDPRSEPVRPLDSATRARLDAGQTVTTAGKTCVNNTARYASHFLRYPDGSDERSAEYDAVNHGDPGKLPKSDQGTSYRPAVADKPITDAMEKGGQYQRLLLALVIFAGELGAFLLLGALSVSVVIAQVLVLLLACFAPVALVLGVIPGRGHDWFRGWLSRLGGLLARKAAYSLVLAVLLSVMAALQDASAGLGWLMAFGLQAALCWTVFVQRKQLAGRLTALASGPDGDREDSALRRVLAVYYGSRVVTSAARRLRPRAAPEAPVPVHDDEPAAHDDPPFGPPEADGPSDPPPPPARGPSDADAMPALRGPHTPDATEQPRTEQPSPSRPDTGPDGHNHENSPPASRNHDADHDRESAERPTAALPRRSEESAAAQPASEPDSPPGHAGKTVPSGGSLTRPAAEDEPDAAASPQPGEDVGDSLRNDLRARRADHAPVDEPPEPTAPRSTSRQGPEGMA